MRRILFFALMFVFVAWSVFAFADENATDATNNTTDNSVQYKIELGKGDGALLVIGDGNTIYLPPEAKDTKDQIQPNEITYSQDRDAFTLVLTETDIYIDGTRTRFSKVVIELTAGGWDLLWFEQGE